MAYVGTKIEDLDSFLEEYAKAGSVLRLEPLPTAQHQWGQTCKQVSGYATQAYLHAQGKNSKAPLPQYRHRFPKGYDGMSLRRRSKEVCGSKTGEIYGGKMFKKLFDYDGFDTRLYRTDDETAYQAIIRSLLQAGQPAIVFMDCNINYKDLDQRGTPAMNGGMFEHSQLIVGAYVNKDDALQYIVLQWGGIYSIDADGLFHSTQNLQLKRNPEHYFRVPVWERALPYPHKEKKWLGHNRYWVDLEIGKKVISLMLDKMRWVVLLHLKPFLMWLGKTWYTSIISDKERLSSPPNDTLRGVIATILGDKQDKVAFDQAMQSYDEQVLSYDEVDDGASLDLFRHESMPSIRPVVRVLHPMPIEAAASIDVVERDEFASMNSRDVTPVTRPGMLGSS